MSAIFFIGMGFAFFLAALLIVKKSKASFDYILLAWLVVNGLHLVYFYVNNVSGTGDISLYLLIPGGLLAYLSAPMLYLYVSSLISSPAKRDFWSYFVHFILLVMISQADLHS